MRSLCLCIWVSGFVAALTLAAQEVVPVAETQTQSPALHEVPRVALLLDAALCDGFDFPAGDVNGKGSYRDKSTRRYHQGWSITPVLPEAGGSVDVAFPGELWNGQGGGATDAGQSVYAIGSGTVRSVIDDGAAERSVIEIEHRFVENGTLRTAVSYYKGIADTKLKPGDPVKRRQQIGVIARGAGDAPTGLMLGIQVETAGAPASPTLTPSAFIRERRKLLVPSREPEIFIAMKQDYRLYLFRKGKLVSTFPIALSQDPIGPKTREGDNRTPEGEYRITQKAKGPFGGDYGDYLGKAWIRISYPNAYDARLALAEGRITESQCTTIVSATNARKMPPAKTSLGGGVGIHGWASDWPDGPQHLTWGCLSLREADLMALYDLMQQGALILMHP
ncbi:L,D-transpeptidase family protein [Roseimicrobium sp. ORNL1]|uniref:L,D-transpeptidase family protein n=1 Tax=Roseimicrobium sp. ORNL1 TaxID=2711231 RepID=UPI0013E1E738|nr:L,D-transpeptidase family protein [Roseimicrobium sp. ORNL1]QIF02211.1 L,D-transpeptidase family protein [Roseimicrobium sp. ORNL1]